MDGLDKHRMAPILSANVLDSCTKLVEDVMRVAHHSHCGCVDIMFAAARHVHAQCTRLSPMKVPPTNRCPFLVTSASPRYAPRGDGTLQQHPLFPPFISAICPTSRLAICCRTPPPWSIQCGVGVLPAITSSLYVSTVLSGLL